MKKNHAISFIIMITVAQSSGCSTTVAGSQHSNAISGSNFFSVVATTSDMEPRSLCQIFNFMERALLQLADSCDADYDARDVLRKVAEMVKDYDLIVERCEMYRRRCALGAFVVFGGSLFHTPCSVEDGRSIAAVKEELGKCFCPPTTMSLTM
jgi:hypothetical protein